MSNKENVTAGKKNNKFIFIVTTLLSVILILTATVIIVLLNATPKTETIDSDKISFVKNLNQNESIYEDELHTYYLSAGGIEIMINLDYSKHPKYNEWAEEFGYTYNSDTFERPYSYHFNTYLNDKCYESIGGYFPNATAHSFIGSPCIYVYYMVKKEHTETIEQANENMQKFISWFYKLKDYENIRKLANEDYVYSVKIIEHWPTYFGDESL